MGFSVRKLRAKSRSAYLILCYTCFCKEANKWCHRIDSYQRGSKESNVDSHRDECLSTTCNGRHQSTFRRFQVQSLFVKVSSQKGAARIDAIRHALKLYRVALCRILSYMCQIRNAPIWYTMRDSDGLVHFSNFDRTWFYEMWLAGSGCGATLISQSNPVESCSVELYLLSGIRRECSSW